MWSDGAWTDWMLKKWREIPMVTFEKVAEAEDRLDVLGAAIAGRPDVLNEPTSDRVERLRWFAAELRLVADGIEKDLGGAT